MHPIPDPAAQLAAELRYRETVVAAVAEQVERALSLVESTAHDPRWRGPASRAFANAVERRLQGLISARRSLDVAGGALAWDRREAEQRATEAAAARALAGADG